MSAEATLKLFINNFRKNKQKQINQENYCSTMNLFLKYIIIEDRSQRNTFLQYAILAKISDF